MTVKRLAGAAFVVAVSQASSAAPAQTTYQAIDLSFPGYYGTQALAADAGNAVGNNKYSIYYIRHIAHYVLHAIYWPAGGGAPVDLTPAGSMASQATGASGGRQAGFDGVQVNGVSYSHALVWAGSAANFTDLSTSGLAQSAALGIAGDLVVGYGDGSDTGGYVHAVLWNLAAGTTVDLNGTTHQESVAYAASGNQQVGLATDIYGASDHAMLWNGSASGAVDLNPRSFSTSYAFGVDNGQQVGQGDTLNTAHALLWRGTAASVVDLNPPGYVASGATAVRNGKQVGSATKTNYQYHAMVWSGRASSYIDLHRFLPASFVQSYANGVDAQGNIVGYAVDTAGVDHAILWQPKR